jgi:hypothetical protein
MKKTHPIIIRILACIIGLPVLVFIVVLVLLLHPKSLHSMVQTQAEKYLNCSLEIGSIDLDLFDNFPQMELSIKELSLLNPFPGAPNDTLLGLKQIKASVHLGKLLTQRALVIDTFLIDRLNFYAYIDSNGKSNFAVLNLESDPEDTTALTLPFESVQLGFFELQEFGIMYVDEADSILALANGLNLDLNLKYREQMAEGMLCLSSPDLSLEMDGASYLDRDSLKMELPFYFEDNKLNLTKALLALNHFRLQSSGSIALHDQGLLFDLGFETAQAAIQPSLQLLPPVADALPEGVFVDGLFGFQGKIKGLYNDSLMPEILLFGTLKNGFFSYDDPAVELKDLSSEVELFVDMNHKKASYVVLREAKAHTGKSSLEGGIFINDLLGDDMHIDLDMALDLDLQETAGFLPEDMDISLIGRAKGPGKARFFLSELMELNLQQMHMQTDLLLQNFKGRYRDYRLETSRGRLNLTIPNDNSLTSLLNAHLYQCPSLSACMDSSLKAELQQAKVYFELSDVMSTTDSVAFSSKLKAEKALVWYDQIAADIVNPKAEIAMQMDFVDSTAVSDLHFDVEAEQLYGQMDSVRVNIKNPVARLQMKGQEEEKSRAFFKADYSSSALNLRYGQEVVKTESLGIRAEAYEDNTKEQLLLRWNPKLEVYLQEGDIELTAISEKIFIPDIRFNYSNEVFSIIDSRIQLGNSDFQLMGNVLHIGDYLNNTGSLKAELNFVSNLTDVNQLMKLTSGLGETENEENAEPEGAQAYNTGSSGKEVAQAHNTGSSGQEEATPADSTVASGPFLVPKNIDLNVNTSIMNAYVGNQIATNLTGRLYVKDDALVLEEIGFVSAAARLKLTALYRSPRPNHLYLGLDYHMVDIQIDELLSMFPDLDTIMPMLSSFKGQGEFHLAAETYLDKNYNLKKSTLRGASSIRGDNLVLMDSETFSKISKILMFNKKTENKIDSLSAEFTVFKNEVDVYPFTIVMDKYKAVVGGRHNLDMSFDYHISLLESPLPMRLGVNISGTTDDLKIRPAACKYPENYRPVSRRVVDAQKLELRRLIRETLIKQME